MRIDRLTEPPGQIRAAGRVVATRSYLARGLLSRLVGLLGTADLRPGEALWIPRCRSVHSFGMRRPILCVFIDEEGVVLHVVELAPWRMAVRRSAAAVVEFSPRHRPGIAPGQRLVFSDDV